MFVITADQVDSRHTSDAVEDTLAAVNSTHKRALELPAERTAGDEIQLLTADATTALSITLELFREGRWSIGLAPGDVEFPLGSSTRASTGDAFFAARTAVERAKPRLVRFACEPGARVDRQQAEDLDALVSILLLVLDRRTDGGWEVRDLLSTGMTQAEAAERLGITPGAVSLRVRAAGIRQEDAAVSALVRMLENLNPLPDA
ncbi:DNA-binding protein [Paramicrobacterium chengjingii]|uniref:DNA-binding protein n=1 Tax=Paramicrobacterium chengjingii TaxID=2769067 RepID=A0ABX6YFC6_9MICO|nr:DNA-binding protein [Microbacterium chengjingii]QPZ37110.1 DNA-binding protein [Microbacterium chengjingii]